MATRKTDKVSTLAEALGFVIKSRREEQGMTQDQLASTAGIDRSYMSQVERGLKNITLPVLWNLAGALHVAPAKIIQEVAALHKSKG